MPPYRLEICSWHGTGPHLIVSALADGRRSGSASSTGSCASDSNEAARPSDAGRKSYKWYLALHLGREVGESQYDVLRLR